ncbi:PTS lactose/cellobiose transporter subunit IIA [Lentilactobacillus otakiensis]|uniref:PTS lactose/cellobiose transporter subunit IIA n=1 Tax=Lentilactobacillus otakiensis DSM 19908 = JCM 15040 TaxID=1423780 RepID=S4NA48_9LACO|nr:PTS lactose/cellobiose transporter subunit IIA [Lentilactobacillus otakiensis]KRL09522.1 hypothetical protein FD05_GL001626 [Lentilactobacillus otakiensis DSM 19908 = JCM 15040]MBZ3775942.1 PTS lactose/cellobiose transporter subunit IIA [Lentilactobacillus otakiensis]MDV3517633.1 PTS lactose/cellobiose transporter subunit IIA [Lentilactobacillus otakiensis]GAD15464.1 hypothetical protein LOT_0002 [Lentilactobacillus otakiensis DSM 19908 = JCM 15040]
MTDDQLNQISMQMLTCSGNAKKILSEVMNDMNSGEGENNLDSKMVVAHQWLVKAHKYQNKVIAEAESIHYSVLFTHAQDTLMNTETIEFIIKKFIPLLRNAK